MTFSITEDAARDLDQILDYTFTNFGAKQAEKYKAHLQKCLDTLASGARVFRTKALLGETYKIMHCQKHYIIAIHGVHEPISIIAVFHERMDLMNRLKERLNNTQ